MRGTLTFTPAADVEADHERPGLLRARAVEHGAEGDVHNVELIDLADGELPEPGFLAAGFATADIAAIPRLQDVLRIVRDNDHLREADAAEIRASLADARLSLSDDTTLRVVAVADDGLLYRRAGPNGLDVNPGGIDGINGHGGAGRVHGDQDVYGTPLRQMMNGSAPELFRHITPDGRNEDADLCMVNLWIPLHAPVQPLALMDRRTLDPQRHQLRYGLRVDGFLDRDEDATVNDIWAFLHDDAQQWYIRTDMGPDTAYVFDTLGVAHAAATLDGEDAVEALFLVLDETRRAIETGDATALARSAAAPRAAPPPASATSTIRSLWQHMSDLLDEAAGTDPAAWCAAASALLDTSIRRSIEVRLVARVTRPPRPSAIA